jgi:hypothetical protein
VAICEVNRAPLAGALAAQDQAAAVRA